MRFDQPLRRFTRSIAPVVRPRLGRAAHQGSTADAVHFHRGPQGLPAVCDDPRCASPQLDV